MSYANFSNLSELDAWYTAYLNNPDSVGPDLASFFQGFELGKGLVQEVADTGLFELIDAYRRWGHLAVRCNPLQTTPPTIPACLSDLPSVAKFKEIYCSKIGFEYMHIENPEIRTYIQQKVEQSPPSLSKEDKLQILQYLTQTELLETFLHTKYTGQKRFSLEGCETLIPLLCSVIDEGTALGLKEVVIGSSHRGRLNLLANILGKSYQDIFYEFTDDYLPLYDGSDDVKYHKGFVGTFKGIPISIAPNASHLDSADSISEGICRAKQDRVKEKRSILPILMHGDASMAGQGVIYETLQLSSLPGYETQGTIHIVINNQVGFTTSSKEGRSTRYCSDLGKAFDCPIFHVNAEDPLSCIYVAKLSIDIRQQFGIDVFIDLNCYRKYGHNEGDEPFFTQPLEYALIQSKETIYSRFCKTLIEEQILSKEDIEKRASAFKELLQQHLNNIPPASERLPCTSTPPGFDHVKTAVDKSTLLSLATKFCAPPTGVNVHPKIQRLMQERLTQLQEDNKPSIDWGMAEHLAFASLLAQQIPIRLSGQDSGRGTFSHRHAILIDQVNATPYIPLNHLNPIQAQLSVYNSPLSEYAVLGFEFGYSSAAPASVVIWEAQFGDFCNTAQVIIDQYIASSEQKWDFRSGVTLFLPHGYDGQGPDHSNARIERFLQLAAQNNMRIVYPSTPVQFFHILREQALSTVKKPLILFTPKVLLRHPDCKSEFSAFYQGKFEEVLQDPLPKEEVLTLILCTGRVYYDLLKEREKRKQFQTALIRIEQLYPFPKDSLTAVLQSYKKVQTVRFVQEEPENTGAWHYLEPLLHPLVNAVQLVSRAPTAATATGSHALHDKELSLLLNQAFA